MISKKQKRVYFICEDKRYINILIIPLYVDDLIFTGNDEKMIEEFKEDMMKKYEMSDLGLLHYFLGIEIHQKEESVFICQNKYARTILKKFGMSNCNPVATPLIVNEKLKKKMEVKKWMHLFIEAWLEACYT